MVELGSDDPEIVNIYDFKHDHYSKEDYDSSRDLVGKTIVAIDPDLEQSN